MRYSFFSRLWNSKRSFAALQISIMAISLVPLVLVQQATKSILEEITRRTIETSSAHASLHLVEFKNEDIAARIAQAKAAFFSRDLVQSVSAEITGGAIARNNAARAALALRGVEQPMLNDASTQGYLRAVKGTLSLEPIATGRKSILLGESLARDLSAAVGDTLLVMTNRGSFSDAPGADSSTAGGFSGRLSSEFSGGLPKITRFTVTGIFSAGYEELDRSWAFISLDDARQALAPSARQVFIKIKTSDPFMFPNPLTRRSLRESREGARLLSSLAEDTREYGALSSWYEENAQKYQFFVQTRRMLSAVMLAAVLLAAVTLSSTMGMRVIDLETDFAVLKAMGADPRALEQRLFLQALVAGCISAILGIAGGVALHAASNTFIAWADAFLNAMRGLLGQAGEVHVLNREFYLQKIPFTVYWKDLAFIAACTMLISTAAAYFPARRLRNISALQIIRRR